MRRPTEVQVERWHLIFWLVPGLVLTVLLRDVISWTNTMSWWALVWTSRASLAAVQAKHEARRAGGEE